MSSWGLCLVLDLDKQNEYSVEKRFAARSFNNSVQISVSLYVDGTIFNRARVVRAECFTLHTYTRRRFSAKNFPLLDARLALHRKHLLVYHERLSSQFTLPLVHLGASRRISDPLASLHPRISSRPARLKNALKNQNRSAFIALAQARLSSDIVSPRDVNHAAVHLSMRAGRRRRNAYIGIMQFSHHRPPAFLRFVHDVAGEVLDLCRGHARSVIIGRARKHCARVP